MSLEAPSGAKWEVVGKTPAGVLDCEAARQGEGQQARVNAHAECAGTMEWTGGRVVEGARLESVYTGDRIAGSNPALSASLQMPEEAFSSTQTLEEA